MEKNKLKRYKVEEIVSFTGHSQEFILEIYKKRNMYTIFLTDARQKNKKRLVYKSTSFKNSMKYFNSAINSYTNNI